MTTEAQEISNLAMVPLPPPSKASLFLDFDGTLVDIAPTPDAVVVPDTLPSLLSDLDQKLSGRLAIVSGRAVADIRGILDFYQGIVVGGHGAETFRDGTLTSIIDGSQAPLAEAIAALQRFADGLPGLLCEPKATGVVLHYRGRPEAEAVAKDAASKAVKSLPGFELHEAKMAIELKHHDATKGHAVAELAREFSPALPIAIGDDTTDEDMFAAALKVGGTAIKVGSGPTAAPYRCADPAAAHNLLHRWLAET